MTKYAELPNGKRLSFPDSTSDKDMQIAVRKELGLDVKDILGNLDSARDGLKNTKDLPVTRVADAVARLATSVGSLPQIVESMVKTLDKVQQAVSTQSAKSNKTLEAATTAIDEAARHMTTMRKAIDESNAKVVRSMNLIVEPLLGMTSELNSTMLRFNRSLADMMSKTDAKQAVVGNTLVEAIAVMTQRMHEIPAVVTQLTKAVEAARVTSKFSKKVYRNPDGTWSMDVVEPGRKRLDG